MSKSFFRAIVGINLALSLTLFFLFTSTEWRLQHMPPMARVYMEWQYAQPATDFTFSINGAGLLAWIATLVASIGLIFFYDWARYGFLIAVIVVVGLNLFEAFPFLYIPYEYILDTILSLISGAIIALAFYSPVRDYFKEEV